MLGTLAASLLLLSVSGGSPIPAEGMEPPPRVVSTQADLNEAYGTLERCDETTARLGFGAALAAATSRYYAALRRAQGIWGNAISPTAETAMLEGIPAACRKADIAEALKAVELAFDAEDRAFADATHHMAQGAWIGPLKLCKDTVANVESGFEAIAGQPALLVQLQPRFATTLSVITERSVNGPLAIRLEGEVIAEPIVFERIDGGELQVTGPDLPKLKTLADAAKGQCQASVLAMALQSFPWPIDLSASRAAMPSPSQRETKPA